jgi:poly(3-hydroxybutyrate) depolymerase
MKSFFNPPRILIVLLLWGLAQGGPLLAQSSTAKDKYTLIIEGYDWGPAVNKVVLPVSDTLASMGKEAFRVTAHRSTQLAEMGPEESEGQRKVVYTYRSDGKGKRLAHGDHVTLVLYVAPNEVLGSPIKYIRANNRGSNQWLDYRMSVTHVPTGRSWNSEGHRLIPPIADFDLQGRYTQNGTTLSYASYAPNETGKHPLIIWLHGGGEGGTDPSIPLLANKAAHYASDNIQAYFGGAFVLVPQSPTFWMQAANGDYTRGQEDDVYNAVLMGLIEQYVADHPTIDKDRVYVGGCSNGGYMSLKLILEHPDYFAAGYISALAYHNAYISDAQVERIKHMPIWFLHAKDDGTTVPQETVLPLYERLIAAGAEDTHLSFYDHVVDLTGFYGGADYHYNGHWSWIYSHANAANFDFDGSLVRINGMPVTLMEWMAQQSK